MLKILFACMLVSRASTQSRDPYLYSYPGYNGDQYGSNIPNRWPQYPRVPAPQANSQPGSFNQFQSPQYPYSSSNSQYSYSSNQGVACSPQQRIQDLNGCISYIVSEAQRSDKFWFGSMYESLCQQKNDRFSECFGFRPNGVRKFKSLGSRIFLNDNPTTYLPYIKTIQTVPTIVYTSDAGPFTGCNATMTQNKAVSFEIYPGMQPVTPYMVRKPPKVFAPGCSATKPCTLVFYDAGIGIVNNIWVNWDGTKNLTDYIGPTTIQRNPSPNVWMYYYQNGPISYLFDKSRSQFDTNFRNIQRQYNLSGPIGLTWQEMVTDVYSQNILQTDKVAQNCPTILINNLLKDNDLCAMTGYCSVPELDTWLSMQYYDSSSFPNFIVSRGQTLWIDSINNGIVAQATTANTPALILEPRLLYPIISRDIQDPHSFLLLESISDTRSRTFFVRWFVANGIGQNLNNFIQVSRYSGSTGIHHSPKQYYGFLFKQNNGVIDLSQINNFLSQQGCAAVNHYRCSFAVPDLMQIEPSYEVTAIVRFKVV